MSSIRVRARLAHLQDGAERARRSSHVGTWEGGEYSYPRQHSISLMCDDIEATVAELEAKGASFTGPVEDMGFGLATSLEVPGADAILVYEPRHPIAHSL